MAVALGVPDAAAAGAGVEEDCRAEAGWDVEEGVATGDTVSESVVVVDVIHAGARIGRRASRLRISRWRSSLASSPSWLSSSSPSVSKASARAGSTVPFIRRRSRSRDDAREWNEGGGELGMVGPGAKGSRSLLGASFGSSWSSSRALTRSYRADMTAGRRSQRREGVVNSGEAVRQRIARPVLSAG